MQHSSEGILDKPVSRRRRRGQRGVEALEFGLFAILMGPALIWMFTNGMNFLRFNKANDVTRSAALMYVKGTNMAVIGSQIILQRVAEGLDLEVTNGLTGGSQALSNSLGSGLIVISQVQYVGATTCPTGCTNLNKYVFMQRINIGNTNLSIADDNSTVASVLGNPVASSVDSSTGLVTNPHGDTGALTNQNFANIWTGGSMVDGQYCYVIEAYFKGSFGTGQFNGKGIYTRILM